MPPRNGDPSNPPRPWRPPKSNGRAVPRTRRKRQARNERVSARSGRQAASDDPAARIRAIRRTPPPPSRTLPAIGTSAPSIAARPAPDLRHSALSAGVPSSHADRSRSPSRSPVRCPRLPPRRPARPAPSRRTCSKLISPPQEARSTRRTRRSAGAPRPEAPNHSTWFRSAAWCVQPRRRRDRVDRIFRATPAARRKA